MTYLQTLINQRCACVPCPDCFGSGQAHIDRDGRIAQRVADAADVEACKTCHESGFVTTCSRCLAIDYILKHDDQILEAA